MVTTDSNYRHSLETTLTSSNEALNMGKNGTECCAFGSSKRKKSKLDQKTCQSDSEGSADDESEVKRKFPQTFHS